MSDDKLDQVDEIFKMVEKFLSEPQDQADEIFKMVEDLYSPQKEISVIKTTKLKNFSPFYLNLIFKCRCSAKKVGKVLVRKGDYRHTRYPFPLIPLKYFWYTLKNKKIFPIFAAYGTRAPYIGGTYRLDKVSRNNKKRLWFKRYEKDIDEKDINGFVSRETGIPREKIFLSMRGEYDFFSKIDFIFSSGNFSGSVPWMEQSLVEELTEKNLAPKEFSEK